MQGLKFDYMGCAKIIFIPQIKKPFSLSFIPINHAFICPYKVPLLFLQKGFQVPFVWIKKLNMFLYF